MKALENSSIGYIKVLNSLIIICGSDGSVKSNSFELVIWKTILLEFVVLLNKLCELVLAVKQMEFSSILLDYIMYIVI